MGSCVSVHKSSQSTMELKQGVSVESRMKDERTVLNTGRPVAGMGLKSQTSCALPVSSFHDLLNNKEDMFFDSQAYLESDSEDFLSVNGDFTPSCGTSPAHQSSLVEPPTDNKSLFEDKPPPNSTFESSPADKKKKLLELFHEGSQGEPINGDKKLQGNGGVSVNSAFDESPCTSVPNSGCTSERTPNSRTRTEKVNLAASAASCFPSFVRSLSISERRKKTPSPAHSGTA